MAMETRCEHVKKIMNICGFMTPVGSDEIHRFSISIIAVCLSADVSYFIDPCPLLPLQFTTYEAIHLQYNTIMCYEMKFDEISFIKCICYILFLDIFIHL